MEHTVLSAEVAAALASGDPAVALESTIISHGLPRPRNLELALALEEIVRSVGAVPATVAVLDGTVRIGLDAADLDRLATDPDVRKLSVRDLAPAVAARFSGATTVAATAHLAARAGIAVFATGGLGGVHPAPRPGGSQWDVSADLDTLARTPIAVVCSGVKSLLDVPATLERLETLGVLVVGYRTDEFPGFYVRSTGLRTAWRVDSPARAAALLRARTALGVPGAVIVANPVPGPAELDPTRHAAALRQALTAADTEGVRGPDLTPFLLAALATATGGATVASNVALAKANAELAARIAVALVD
jgi:pseudouridine-5'-phosphate glycosidase